MGTPEDVAAENYFTPPTNLTDMLRTSMYMEPTSDADAKAIEDTLNAIKTTFKAWLKDVAIGVETKETLLMRKTLITLINEP